MALKMLAFENIFCPAFLFTFCDKQIKTFVLKLFGNQHLLKCAFRITFKALRNEDTHYMALGMNYSTAGFELILSRKMSFYIITYYLPSGLFVGISWVR